MDDRKLLRSLPVKRLIIAILLFLIAIVGITVPVEISKENGESILPESLGVTGFAILGGQVGSGTSIFPNPLSPISVTNNSVVNPNNPVTPIESVDTVQGLKIVDGDIPGEFLVFINDNDANHIIIDGTGDNVRCGKDIDLGPGDTVMIAWDTQAWHCVSYYDRP